MMQSCDGPGGKLWERDTCHVTHHRLYQELQLTLSSSLSLSAILRDDELLLAPVDTWGGVGSPRQAPIVLDKADIIGDLWTPGDHSPVTR